MRPEDDEKLQLPPFTPIFNGILEHIASGMTPTEVAVYLLLHMKCDWTSGVWLGTAPMLAHAFGGGAELRTIQKGLLKLRDRGLIRYRLGNAKHEMYPVFINKYLVRIGPLEGYKLNPFAFSHLRAVAYDSVRGEHADIAWSVDGGYTVRRLGEGGACGELARIQEYKRFKSVIVTEYKRSRIILGSMSAKDLAEGYSVILTRPAMPDPNLIDYSKASRSPEAAGVHTNDGNDANLDPDYEDTKAQDNSPKKDSPKDLSDHIDLSAWEENSEKRQIVSTSDAARELSMKIYKLMGHNSIDKLTRSAAARKLHPLLQSEGYKKLTRVIEWAILVDTWWPQRLANGTKTDKCPVSAIVRNYETISRKAHGAFLAEDNAQKRVNPDHDPDVDDPNTPMGKLAAGFKNQPLTGQQPD